MSDVTYFASAERSSEEEITRKNKVISSLERFSEIFNSITGIGAVLDKNRQVVYANENFVKSFGFSSMESLLGKRPGEAISCIHSEENRYGCGTSEACSVCGAVNAVLECQATGLRTSRETRITTSVNGQNISLDLKVTSDRLKISDEDFYMVMLEDISNEKRRITLERIFFHDILNIAGSLNGLLTILKEGTDPEEARSIIGISEETSRNLIEEIMLHRQIRAAENGDLDVKIEKMGSVEFLNSAAGKMKYHECATGKTIIIDKSSDNIEFESDRILLQRVIINLLKNALEATPQGGSVTVGSKSEKGSMVLYVKNSGVISNDIKLQVFQRSFSTKGRGRGIGTYSIKLLTENYLRGKAGFISNEYDGTIFTIRISPSWKESVEDGK